MTLYSFDIIDDDDVIPDEEGLNLPDLCAAAAEAFESLADLTRDNVMLP